MFCTKQILRCSTTTLHASVGRKKYTGEFVSSQFCIKSLWNVSVQHLNSPKLFGYTTVYHERCHLSNQASQAFPTTFALSMDTSFCASTLACYSTLTLTFHARYFLFSTLYLFHSLMTARSTCSETGRKNGEYTAKQCSNE